MDSAILDQYRGHDDNAGEARIVDGRIVIVMPIDRLQHATMTMFAINPSLAIRVDDPEVFARHVVSALSSEDEQGTTPVHRMMEEAYGDAFEQGEGSSEIEDYDEAEALCESTTMPA